MSSAAFDAVGSDYDDAFTTSAVGRAQRAAVWRYLDERVLGSTALDVLELGCGTGEDAVRLATAGHRVRALDLSDRMLEVAHHKATTAGVAERVHLQHLDLRRLDQLASEPLCDLVLSDFGALNCLDPAELAAVGRELGRLTRPGGRAVLVVMPRGCPWEWLWFAVHGRPWSALRRLRRGPVEARVGDATVATWYHGPGRIRHAFGPAWRVRGTRAIGLAVPPSYLDPLVARRPRLLAAMVALDRVIAGIPGSAAIADHCLVDLELAMQRLR